MIIVSGSMRSGTSLMCQVLVSLDYKPATDGKRQPDEHNPNGYFEIEGIGEKVKENPNIIDELEGDFLKVVSLYIDDIPKKYDVIFMVRNHLEIADSIGIMRGKGLSQEEVLEIGKFQDDKMFEISDRSVVYIDFNDLIEDPVLELEKLHDVLGSIDVTNAVEVVDESLYRSRK